MVLKNSNSCEKAIAEQNSSLKGITDFNCVCLLRILTPIDRVSMNK